MFPYCFGSNKRIKHQTIAPDAATINRVSGSKNVWLVGISASFSDDGKMKPETIEMLSQRKTNAKSKPSCHVKNFSVFIME